MVWIPPCEVPCTSSGVSAKPPLSLLGTLYQRRYRLITESPMVLPSKATEYPFSASLSTFGTGYPYPEADARHGLTLLSLEVGATSLFLALAG